MRTLRRRVKAIEQAVFPPPEKVVRILIEPGAGADPGNLAAFKRDLARAKKTADLVLMVPATNRPLAAYEEDGCMVCASEAEAQIIALACQPSDEGRENRLADVLAGLSGNVVGVVALRA